MESALKITKLQEQMKNLNSKIDTCAVKIDKLEEKIDDGFDGVKEELKCYVRHEEFATVKAIAYGAVGMILTAFMSGLIYLVFK